MKETVFAPFHYEPSKFNPVKVVAPANLDERLTGLLRLNRIALVTSAGFLKRGLVARVQAALGESLVEVITDVNPNPELDLLVQQAARLRQAEPEAIVGIGGGSVIDSAKVLGVLLAEIEFDLRETLIDDHGEGAARSQPVYAVPTTAGTGAEVTPFATVWDSGTMKKYSLTGPGMYPCEAWLDGSLSLSVPHPVTVATGLDVISQALESIWNKNTTTQSRAFALEALKRALVALPKLLTDLSNIEYRQLMLEASTYAGLAISQTRTAIAHSMSYPLTLHFGLPHGLAAGFTLPAILRFNAEHQPEALMEVIDLLGFADAESLAVYLDELLESSGALELVSGHVRNVEQALPLVGEMFTPNRAGNNIRELSEEAVEQLLVDSFKNLT